MVAGLLGGAGAWIWQVQGLPGDPHNPLANATSLGQFALALAALVIALWPAIHPSAVLRSRALGSPAAQLDAAADLLAQRTFATWSKQAVQRGIVVPAPVQVRWAWADGDTGLSRDELNASPCLGTDPLPLPRAADPVGDVPGKGTVPRLYQDVYASLQHGRLVLVGAPGAGKTGAMILLLLEILRHRAGRATDIRTATPVPLWLTLGSWNPREEGLREWVVTTAARDHPYLRAADFGPDGIGQLYDGQRIVLFLDGLDEMPDGLRAAALHRLRTESAGLRLVLSSRPEEYRASLAQEELPHAAVIELRPVLPRDAEAYLLTGHATDASRACWQRVTDHLRSRPGSVVSNTLNSPLTLSLARSAYARRGPGELLSSKFSTEESLRRHLLDQLLVAAYADSRERAHAMYWLGWIAHHLGAGRDLPWWGIPRWIPRRRLQVGVGLLYGLRHGVAGMAAVGLAFGLATGLTRGLVAGLVHGLISGLAGGLANGLAVGVASGRAATRTNPPEQLVFRWPTLLEAESLLRCGVTGALTVGLTGGLAVGLAVGPGIGITVGLAGGLSGGLAGGVAGGLQRLWSVPSVTIVDATAGSTHRKDLQAQLTVGFLAGLSSGVAGGVAVGLAVGLTAVYPAGLAVAVAVALVYGLVVGIVTGVVFKPPGGASAHLLVAEALVSLRGRGVRFLPLLETALHRQVLRRAGSTYQFRHAELQDHLATWYREHHLVDGSPPSGPQSPTGPLDLSAAGRPVPHLT